MISAALNLAFQVRPDPLSAASAAVAGLESIAPGLSLLINEGDAWFHRVYYPANSDHNYAGTMGVDDSHFYGNFPGFDNRAGGGSVPVQDPFGLALQLTTLRLLLVRVQRIVEYLPAFASTTINSTAVIPTNGDTITLGSKTYTFKTTLSAGPAVEGEVLIAGSAAAALLNLSRAIRLTGTPGTDYTAAAAHPEVTADATVTTVSGSLLTLGITALVGGEDGNALASTTTATTLSFPGATLSGGAATASPLVPAPFDGTVTVYLANGILPGGATNESKVTFSEPGWQLIALDGAWTPAAASSFAVKYTTSLPGPATDQDVNAVATVLLIGNAA